MSPAFAPDTSRAAVQEARSKLSELIEEKMYQERLKSLQDFADKYGLGRSTLYELVRGRSRSRGAWVKPSIDTMVTLAHALDRPLHELIYLIEPGAPGAEELTAAEAGVTVEFIPVEVAGWTGAGPERQGTLAHQPAIVESSFARGKQLRAFRIRGDSMAAGVNPIHDGDIVIVDTNDPGYNTANVIARLDGGAYVCKVLKDDRYGRLLQSRNIDHTNGTPSAIPMDEVEQIIGRVVRTIHDE